MRKEPFPPYFFAVMLLFFLIILVLIFEGMNEETKKREHMRAPYDPFSVSASADRFIF